MAMLFADPFGTFLQFQQALDALRASSWLEPSVSGGGTDRKSTRLNSSHALDQHGALLASSDAIRTTRPANRY
jgi:hypothetical protein